MKNVLLVLTVLVGLIYLSKSQSCECPRSVYAGQSGVITSPNYPNDYCPRLTCNYFITVFDGHFVKLTFTDYAIVVNDWVYIYDGDKTNDDSKLITQSYSQHIFSGSNQLSVKFVVDDDRVARGFTATFQAVTNYCGPTVLNTATDLLLQSPNYPDNYPNNAHCMWTITASRGNFIELTFDADSLTELNDDRITVLGSDGSVLAQLSGGSFSPVRTEDNVMRVLFTSDENVIKKGFRAIFRAKNHIDNCTCQMPTTQSITNPANCKTLSSPHFPYAHCENHNCTWYLTVPEDFNVRITFNEFNLKPDIDFVDVFDGVGVAGQPLASCTGTSCPITVSSGSWMTVRFKTHGPVESIGWSASWCPLYVI